MKHAKKLLALLLALAMVLSLAACAADPKPTETQGTQPTETQPKPTETQPTQPQPTETQPTQPQPTETQPTQPAVVVEYIAPATSVAEVDELNTKVPEPVFYENKNGPTIGVTLLGVIKVTEGSNVMYFRDMNNNKKLDTFEDWRLDDKVRAEAYAASLSDHQLAYELLNKMMWSSKNTLYSKVVDADGNVVMANVMPNGWIATMEKEQFRNYVVRNNADGLTGVLFNNGMEQYAEFDAIRNGETAVPFLTFTNPINHGLPGSEGVAAVVQGMGGDASLVLKDAQLDNIMMWSKGIEGLYGPQIDLVTDPRWSRNNGTYGENENISAAIAAALTEGYQKGTSGMVEGSVLLTVKHFPGDGAAFNGFESHGFTGRYRVYMTENSLADYQLKPFIAAFEAGAAGVMPGYSQPINDTRIAPQHITYNGKTYNIKLDGYGNAFNKDVLQYLLREVLGFEGLINSDSISQSNCHGVENMSGYDQTVLFIKAGCDAGVFTASGAMGNMVADPTLVAAALKNGDVTREELELAAYHRALPQIQSGNMDNPYRSEADAAAFEAAKVEAAELAVTMHEKSIVLMKNKGNVLPMAAGSKVYVRNFTNKANAANSAMEKALTAAGYTIVATPEEADIAFLYVNPTMAGQGSKYLAVLDLVEDVETPLYDNNAKPTGEVQTTTTVRDMKKFQEIATTVRSHGGKVVGRIEASNAWILTNMEPYCDALIGTFGNTDAAIVSIVSGAVAPTGKLPLTMVSDAAVIAVVSTKVGNQTWDVCVSPNDVPGYVKDQFIDDAILATVKGNSYAYRDTAGHYYFSGFGLTYKK